MTALHRRFASAAASLLLLLTPLTVSADDPVEITAIVPMTGGAAFIGKGLLGSVQRAGNRRKQTRRHQRPPAEVHRPGRSVEPANQRAALQPVDRQARAGRTGLNVPVYTNAGNLTYGQMAQYHDFLPKELDFPAVACVVPDGITDSAVKAATATYFDALRDIGVKPEYIQSVAYDPALLVVTAYRALGPNPTAARLRDYLNSLSNFAGVSGRYNFKATPQRGLGTGQIFVARWDPAQNNWAAVSKSGGDPR